MALDQSALSELLDALRAGGDLDVVREALALVLQALIVPVVEWRPDRPLEAVLEEVAAFQRRIRGHA